jgi:4-hydroxy-2-oxoglutarate aldolase
VMFSGVFTALTTPYAPDGRVSLPDLKHNIQRYNQTELGGYVALGSTGESVLLTRAEMDGILITVKESAAKGKKLLAGAGAESTAETIERTKRAAELGYDAALVKTPYYYKPAYKPEVLIAHYRRVADESPIPVLLYSIPQFTGIALAAADVAALAGHPNIIGIKDSSGNVQGVAEIVAATPPAFQVLVGSAASVYPSMVIGARGAILALACALAGKMRGAIRFGPARPPRKGARTAIDPASRIKADRFRDGYCRRKVRHGPARLPRGPAAFAFSSPAPRTKETS